MSKNHAFEKNIPQDLVIFEISTVLSPANKILIAFNLETSFCHESV